MSKILHVFCGPFPTYQGTQVLVGQTCRMSAMAGAEVHLLTYSHGAYSRNEPFTVHRIPNHPRFDSERSGLAWQKPLLDLSIAVRARSLCASLKPDILHLHHYEALLACSWSRLIGIPTVFHLHALFEPELGTYVPKALSPLATLAGRKLDHYGPSLADLTVVVHPWIRDQLLKAGHCPKRIRVLKPPAELTAYDDITAAPRQGDMFELLYTGNLDAYQDLDALFDGLAKLPASLLRKIKLKIVTPSGTDLENYPNIDRRVSAQIEIIEHGTYAETFSLMKSTDLVVVPRRTPGGAPIKMANALAAGVPLLADPMVAHGIIHEREAWLVDMGCSESVASGIATLMENPKLSQELRKGAVEASKREHSPKDFIQKLHVFYSDLLSEHDPRFSFLQNS